MRSWSALNEAVSFRHAESGGLRQSVHAFTDFLERWLVGVGHPLHSGAFPPSSGRLRTLSSILRMARSSTGTRLIAGSVRLAVTMPPIFTLCREFLSLVAVLFPLRYGPILLEVFALGFRRPRPPFSVPAACEIKSLRAGRADLFWRSP